MSYKELLPSRVPEAVQGENELKEYLEAAGELFDEFVAEIEAIDHYHDAARVPQKRLPQLAAQFAMEFPRNLNESLQRDIIRDLTALYQKCGTRDLINWIFRLIGWDVSLEYAWVLNPEKYDPEIKNVFGLDDYGREQIETVITDYYRRDYRAFLLGQEMVFDNGTYFRGRKFFDQRDTLLKNEIVGEYYDNQTKTRTPDKAMATPYLFIRVSEETYNIFISPYVDEETGIEYDYTEVEFFRVVENIFNFFLFEEMRASHVRVVIIVTAQNISDDFVISDEVTETWEADDLAMEELSVVGDAEYSIIYHDLLVGTDFLAGTPPSPYHKDVVLSSISYRNLVDHNDPANVYVDQQDRTYVILQPENEPVPRCGTDTFHFFTPHEDTFWFRRAYESEDTVIDPTGTSSTVYDPYPDDLDDLTLLFDMETDEYAIVEFTPQLPIVVRNPTNVDSPNFTPSTKPADAFDIGGKVLDPDTGLEVFDSNLMVGFDFREGGELLANLNQKSFYYIYDMDIYSKENNASDVWALLVSNPTIGALNNLTTVNTIALVFNAQVPYDFIMNVEYQAQPHWENRP